MKGAIVIKVIESHQEDPGLSPLRHGSLLVALGQQVTLGPTDSASYL